MNPSRSGGFVWSSLAACRRAFLAFAAILGGCASPAVVHVVPLNMRTLTEAEPLVTTVHPAECVYWLNDENKLCLALFDEDRAILGRLFGAESAISFVLDEPPAGDGRDYPVGRQTFRAKARSRLTHVRAVSLNGIVVVWNYGKSRLQGRFRLTARQQSYSVLTGWTGDLRVVYTGDFTARPDARRGREILAATEVEALQRTP